MASAVWNIVDWIELDEVGSRLLLTHGGDPTAAVRFELDEPNAHALTRLDVQAALDSDGISKLLLRSVDLDNDLREVMLSSEDLRRAGGVVAWERARLPKLTIVFPAECLAEKLADFIADRNVARRIGRSPPAVRTFLWRRDVERQGWWWPSEPLPAIAKPRPVPVDFAKADPATAPGPLAPKEWIAAAVDDWKRTADYPRKITDAARALEPKMMAAFQAGTCTGHLGWRTIKNTLRDLDPGYDLWPRTKDA